MRIGLFQHGWWKAACGALGHEVVELPVAQTSTGNPYQADLAARLDNADVLATRLTEDPVDLLLDNGGTGLAFVRDRDNPESLIPAHEAANRVLCSHFVDPVVTALAGLGWAEAWASLQSETWIKAVWDRAQALELQRFGVPNVVHLPMAAPNRPYPTDPLDPTGQKPIVSFVGAQNTTYFRSAAPVATQNLIAGTLAHALRSDLPEAQFYDAYHNVYGLGLPVVPEDDISASANKAATYFNAKLFYNATLCLRNRDRFVIVLKRTLGDKFQLVGNGWTQAYGLSAADPFPTDDAYFNHFREAAININLVNGNSETGLNMRHFEITAAGGFMLCYAQAELAEHFEIGKECVVFDHEQDLMDKINHYLDHPNERVAIALAGQRRTLSEHLYSHRLQSLLSGLKLGPMPVEYAKTQPWDDIKALLPEADVALDCGANVGQTATVLRKLYPKADIYSFEPVQAVFAQLRERCAELNVIAVCKAVGDREGTASIHLTASAEANSLLAPQEGNPCAKWTRVVGREEIEVCTLDRWCEQSGVDPNRVGLLKLDVQGAELQALYGARRLLEKVRLVFLEVSFVPIYRDSPMFSEIDGFLKECGYRRHAVYPSDQPHNWGDALYVRTGSER